MSVHKSLVIAGALVLGLTGVAEAQDWSRTRTIIGPQGGEHTFQGFGSCGGGGCASQQTWTGPRGHSVSREGYTVCVSGTCNRSVEWTGPRGGGASGTGTFTWSPRPWAQ